MATNTAQNQISAPAAPVAAAAPPPSAPPQPVVAAKPQATSKSGKAPPVDIGGILDGIIKKAQEMGASDVHMEPREGDMRIRYRIDGILHEIMTVPKNLEQALVFKIKVASKLRTDEHFAPQDGRIRFFFGDKYLDTRISILPVSKGEKVVARLLSQDGRSFGLEDLGFMGKDLDHIRKSFSKPYGMIIASGPTGSGKTTTLYSILQVINKPEINITTIEDPVEYDLPGVNHIQINTKADLTFANGLRSILRQDPDVVMVGEIRDSETAKIAINAAMTGHLVLSTIHTNDSITTIPRLIDMGVEPYLAASTLNVVVAQRLARKLCDKCKREYILDEATRQQIFNLRPDIANLIKVGEKFFKETGCQVCGGTGFKGRIGLYEVLDITEAIRRQITSKANTDDVFKAAREQGLVLIVEDGIRKMRVGMVSVSELIRVTALKE